MEKITVSWIKADVGGFPGHSTVRPKLKEKTRERMEKAKRERLLVSPHVLNAGDDLPVVDSQQIQEEIRTLSLRIEERDKFWKERVLYMGIIVGCITKLVIG